MSRGAPSVVVAGAGVVGTASALALARAGAAVTVVDPAAPGDNASGVAAGMLAPAFESLLDPLAAGHAALLTAARDLWPAFAQAAGIALDRRGALMPAAKAEELAAVLRARGFTARALSAREARALVPGLEVEGPAVSTLDDWRLDAAPALAALRGAAKAAGVRFETGAVDDQPKEGWLLIATGAAQSLATLAPELRKLIPIKGQIVRTGHAYDGPVLRGDRVYITPGPHGAIVGATMEAGRDDRRVDSDQVRGLAARAAELLPGLVGARLSGQAAVRAGVADGLPLVGPSERPGVLLAVGARRNGWLLAPLIAEAVVAYVLDRAPPAVAVGFDPRRAGI